MKTIAFLSIFGVSSLVVLRLLGFTTDVPELNRWVADLMASLGLG